MAENNVKSREHVLVVDNSDKKLNELAKKRCIEAISASGIKIESMEMVTRNEALKHIYEAFGWQNFIENGGLEWHYYEGSLTNKRKELIGLAVVGPKDPVNPKRGKIGAIGIKGGFISLGNF